MVFSRLFLFIYANGGTLQVELDELRVHLQKAEEALEASAAALAERDAFWKEELRRVQQDMQSYQAQVVVCAVRLKEHICSIFSKLNIAYILIVSCKKGCCANEEIFAGVAEAMQCC